MIEPSESPWAAPVVLVQKRDRSLKYCIDYRRLNAVTKKDSYPLPNMHYCLESLDGQKFFSSMGLSSWQVKLSEEAKDIIWGWRKIVAFQGDANWVVQHASHL